MTRSPGNKRQRGRVRRISRPTRDREVVYNVLLEHFHSGRFVSQLLDEASSAAQLIESRGFCTEITCGVVRRQGTLNHLLQRVVSRPRNRVELELWTLLLMGGYQLVYMTGVPQHAALHTTVELAKRIGRPGWSGFVNGVLRSLARLLTDEDSTEPSERAIAVRPDAYRLCADDVFPSPVDEPAAYVARAFSFPVQPIESWLDSAGFEETVRRAFWFNTPGSMSIRVNLHRCTRDEVLDELSRSGIVAEPGELSEAVTLERSAMVVKLPGYADGRFTIQDESAMSAADLLNPQPDHIVLDMCAAPGTKTTHLAERMCNRGSILATDIHAQRLASVNENVRRLGIDIVKTQHLSDIPDDLPQRQFDGVLVDAPCSNTGVLGKRPEARWRLGRQEVAELVAIQQTLMLAAAERVKPGGRLVYSTCSIDPDENQSVVQWTLQRRPELQLEAERCFSPGAPADGAYQALLVRAS